MSSINSLIVQKLVHSPDRRVRELVSATLPSETLGLLISSHLEHLRNFEVRYLSPGKSGASVLLIVSGVSLPLVVKIGPLQQIEKEMQNYEISHVETKLPQELYPRLTAFKRESDFASIAYSWAGGWYSVENFESYFGHASEAELMRPMRFLIDSLFRWQEPQRGHSSPLSEWRWDTSALLTLRESLGEYASIPELKLNGGIERVMRFVDDDSEWRDSLSVRTASRATCHGDLNCHNILFANIAGNPSPRIIDFASVVFGSCPARDWAKLEREVKFRCLTRVVSPGEFSKSLATVEASSIRGPLPTDPQMRKAAVLLTYIREQYRAHTCGVSDIPDTEYYCYLLYWTLAFVAKPEYRELPRSIQLAVIESAKRSLELLDSSLSNPVAAFTSTPHLAFESKELQLLTREFSSEVRIAGQLRDQEFGIRAIYLDERLYVHRYEQEAAVLAFTKQYISLAQPSLGRWMNIVGNAGHGKSSLLWYIHTALTKLDVVVVPIPAAALTGDPASTLDSIVEHNSLADKKVIILIDTLDILIGVNDPALARALNRLRAAGFLTITSCRPQEAARLRSSIQPDSSIELPRFTKAEAQEAIKKYIDVSYPSWLAVDKECQFARNWGLLEQRRDVQELNFEPLILRMIFEAYVPHEIPVDLNTQDVYQTFWKNKVLLDRAERLGRSTARGRICQRLARHIMFGYTTHQEHFFTTNAIDLLGASGEQIEEILEGLVSSGVLVKTHGDEAVRFFHQTFLEYVAALSILVEPSLEKKQSLIDLLFGDVASYNLFRAPVLKQLIVQTCASGDESWKDMFVRLRSSNSEAAAQIGLELVGKLSEPEFALQILMNWMVENPSIFEGFVCEIVRNYPDARIHDALQILSVILTGPREREVYALFTNHLASVAPQEICNLLVAKAPEIAASPEIDKKSLFRDAICQVLAHGAKGAVSALQKIIPGMPSGLQAGTLRAIADSTNPSNYDEVAHFAKEIFEQVANGSKELWSPYASIIAKIRHLNPLMAAQIANFSQRKHSSDSSVVAMLTGRIVGMTAESIEPIERALNDLLSNTHSLRLRAAETLHYSPSEYANTILHRLLGLPSSSFEDEDKRVALLRSVAGLSIGDPAPVFALLQKYPWPHSGAGNSLRHLFILLAERDHDATKRWMLQQIETRTAVVNRPFAVLTGTLLQSNIVAFSSEEVTRIYGIFFDSPNTADNLKVPLAEAIGAVAEIDRDLAAGLFDRMLRKESRKCLIAAINSLPLCTNVEFLASCGDKIVHKFDITRDSRFIRSWLEAIGRLEQRIRASLLDHMERWFSPQLLNQVEDEGTVIALLMALKPIARHNPRLVLEIAERCRRNVTGVMAGLATVYHNVAEHTSDPQLLERALTGLLSTARISQDRIRNALRRALPILDQKLGHGEVARAAVAVLGDIEDHDAMENLIRAVTAIPSWGQEDSKRLLMRTNLPAAVRGLLLIKTRRHG